MLLFNVAKHLTSKHISVLAILLLSACGFTPMYSTHANNTDIGGKLAAVKVMPIKTLMGQEYVSALENILDPLNKDNVNEYVLEAKLHKDVRPLAIESDRTVTRYKIVIVAEYTLTEQSSGKVISQGRIKDDADFDRVESDYATYVSESDITSRIIRELARDTKIRLISALK